MKTLAFIIAFSFGSFVPSSLSVKEKVIEFAKNHMGKKVDTGECWDLAKAALDYANADWKSPFEFGDKIDMKKQALAPADILQFTNVKFVFPMRSMSFPQHTAIIYKVNKNEITIFQQNFNNKRYVDTLTINLDNIKNGKIDAYRPKAKA